MLFIWLAVLILFVGSSWIEHFRARLGIERFKKSWNSSHVAGTGILWARDITGERFGQCSPGDEFLSADADVFSRYWVWEPVYMESLLMLE